MADKRKQAEKLYDCIGGISDRYIADAENYTQHRFLHTKKILASLAACAVILVLVNIFLNVFIAEQSGDEVGENAYISLGDVLEGYEAVPLNTVDLFDGEKLIWYSNGEYREKRLTYDQYTNITNYMIRGFEKTTQLDDECLVWLCDGQGNVVSPYLEMSHGNVYVDLFSYSAEVQPSEAFTKYVQKILT